MPNNKKDEPVATMTDNQQDNTSVDIAVDKADSAGAVSDSTAELNELLDEAAVHDAPKQATEGAKRHKGLAIYLIIMAAGFILLLVFAYFMQQSQQGLEKNIEKMQAEIEEERLISEQKDEQLRLKQEEIDGLEKKLAETEKYVDALKKLPQLAKFVDENKMSEARALLASLNEQGQGEMYVDAAKELFDSLCSIIAKAPAGEPAA